MWSDAVVSLALVLAILLIFYGPWQETCTDLARQSVFARRDRLFDLAADGKLDFNSKEYQITRTSLESIIRYAHTLTWPHFLLNKLLVKPKATPKNRGATLSDAIMQIEDAAVREEVRGLIIEAALHLMLMMALKSIILAPITLLVVLTTELKRLFMKTVRNFAFVESVAISIARSASAADKESQTHGTIPARV